MAYVVVDLDHWTSFSSPPTAVADDYIVSGAFANLAYTPDPRGGTAIIDVSIPDPVLSTASVTPLMLVSNNDFVDVSTATSTMHSAYTIMTEAEFKQKIVDMAPWLYWPLDEGSGTVATDASGNGRNGTIDLGVSSWIAPGVASSWGSNAIDVTTINAVGVSITATIPNMTSSDGYTMIAAVKSTTLANFGPQIDFGGNTNAGYAYGSTTGSWSFGTSTSRVTGTSVLVANTWTLLVFYIRENNYAQLFANGKPAAGATGATTAQPTSTGTALRLLYSTGGTSAGFQHVAFFDKQLTHEQIMSIAGADVVTTTPLACVSTLDVDVSTGDPILTLTTVTSTPALTSDLDLDIVFADPAICWQIASDMDVDVSFAGVSVFWTIFVDLPSTSMDVDISSADAILRRSVFPSGTPAFSSITLTTAAAVGTLTRTTLLLGFVPITMTVDTRSSITKRATLGIPRVPESVSDTDPSQATGLIVRALMGVSVDMNAPIIIDGKPQ
jgi:hypothetical protein